MAKPFVNLELENKVLRAVLPWDDNAENAEKNLKRAFSLEYDPEIFDSEFRRWLWITAVKQYGEKGELCGVNWILSQLESLYKEEEDIDKVKSIFRKILDAECEPEEFRPFLDDLENLHNYRLLLQTHNRGLEDLEKIFNGTKSLHSFDLINEVRANLEAVNTGTSQTRLVEADLFDSIDTFIAELEDKKKNPLKYLGIPTGIPPLTEATDGWQPGELIVVIGRPGKGKSVVLLCFGLTAFEHGKNVVYVSIEMPYEQQRRRGFSNVSRIEYSDIKNPTNLTKADFERMRKSLKKYKDKHENSFHVIDAPSNCTANYINARIEIWRKKTGKNVDLLIIDPLYLMKPNQMPADGDSVGAASWDLKILARNLSIPVIVANQVNRSGQEKHERGKKMDTTDSAFSDKTSQNADTMLGLKTDGIDLLMIEIIKFRDGIGPSITMRREFNTMRMTYVEELNRKNRDDRPTDSNTDDQTEEKEDNKKGKQDKEKED